MINAKSFWMSEDGTTYPIDDTDNDGKDMACQLCEKFGFTAEDPFTGLLANGFMITHLINNKAVIHTYGGVLSLAQADYLVVLTIPYQMV